ncbi:ImuA family protein [Hyphomicrobium sp.]|uniref:ImuA family protein n=1 Tax=Hyphomicrobium sp. TaxID=82 RepID=UPI003F70551A
MTPPHVRSASRTRDETAATRNQTLGELRRMLSRIEGLHMEGMQGGEPDCLSFGLPALDAYLPRGGLAFGAMHEIAPETEADVPAAFGFLIALLARTPGTAPLLLILTARGPVRNARLFGHGLNTLGLDPGRVILVETADEKDALWATEEALRSGVPAAVASTLGVKLDLKTSQRLQVAARESRRALLLMRPPAAEHAATATTRWRITSSEAARDRFGLAARWRWRAALERCRNGRPGEWILEFDHATHCFSLAAALADPALSEERSAPIAQRVPQSAQKRAG